MALTDQLVHYWKLDESSGNATDSVGSLTLTNTNTLAYAAGLVGNATSHDGADYLISTSSGAANSINGGSFTIALWVRFTTAPSSANAFWFSSGETTNQLEYNIYYREVTGTRLRVERVKHGVAANTAEWVTTLSLNTWYFVVYTFDGSTATLYVDTTSRATVASSGNGSAGATQATAIGATVGGAQNAISGTNIDMVGVWTRVLDSGEISQLYNSGAGLQYPFTSTAAATPVSTLLTLGVG